MNMQIGANVLSHVGKGVATVTLNRPQVYNTIDENTRRDLRNVFRSIRGHDEVRAVILTGAGQNFSIGGDLLALEDMTPEAATRHMEDILDTAMAIGTCDIPVIAAVEGRAASAGLGLALLCDWIIAGKESRFTFSYCRVGMGPEWGLSVTLPERVGRAQARKLMWDGAKMDARGALEIGLVDEICLPGQAMSAAWNMAELLAEKPFHSTRSTKCSYRIPPEELGLALETEVHQQSECLTSEDFIEGVYAIRQRRRPEFSR
jgi:2-(1,2-epoxy-1,2-dihydrophenyl)acetyl-CoA isomerase